MAFLAAAGPFLALAGAATSAIGTVSQGEATSNAANFQAQVAKNNQIVANQNAQYAEEAGEASSQATSLKGRAAAGKIKTAQAASGVDVNSGSAVDVQESQRDTSQLDTETVLNNAELQAYGYRANAVNYGAESELEEQEAEEAPIGADLSAGGSLLSGASAVGLKWGNSSPTPGVGPPLNILNP